MSYALGSLARDKRFSGDGQGEYDDNVRTNSQVIYKAESFTEDGKTVLDFGSYTVSYEAALGRDAALEYAELAESMWNTVTRNANGQVLEARLSLSVIDEGAGAFHLQPCPPSRCSGLMGGAIRGGRKLFVKSIQYRTTPAHEFGHIFGLGEQPKSTMSIMSYHHNRSVQYQDLQRLHEVYGK